MRVSVVLATALMCGLSGGCLNYAWSGDLEAALENISIRSDAGNAPKKTESNNLPCTKVVDAQCQSLQDELNGTANKSASAIPDSILNGTIPNVTINGASVDTVNYKSAIVSGGF